MPSLFCTEPAYFLTLFQEPGSLTRAEAALQKLGVTAGNRVDQNVLVFSEMRIRLTWVLRPVNSSSKPRALERACCQRSIPQASHEHFTSARIDATGLSHAYDRTLRQVKSFRKGMINGESIENLVSSCNGGEVYRDTNRS